MDLDEIAGTWWIQLLIWIGVNCLIYAGIEFWRYFPFINGYLAIIINLVLIPFVFIVNHTSFFIIKFFLIAPILIVLTLFRIAYIPNINKENDSPFYKIWLSKLSRFLALYLCCAS